MQHADGRTLGAADVLMKSKLLHYDSFPLWILESGKCTNKNH